MSLKFKFKTREEIPAEHQSLYVERDGAWMLDAEGVVEKAKLDEFRNANIALTNERNELKQRFDGIDPDEVRKLADEKRKLEEAQQVKAGEVDKVGVAIASLADIWPAPTTNLRITTRLSPLMR